jgi:hypothetical protein
MVAASLRFSADSKHPLRTATPEAIAGPEGMQLSHQPEIYRYPGCSFVGRRGKPRHTSQHKATKFRTSEIKSSAKFPVRSTTFGRTPAAMLSD